MQVTSKLNFVEKKRTIQKTDSPKITFLPFFSKQFRMTIKPLKIASKIIFISRKINLNIQNLKIISYNQKKNAKMWSVIFAVQYTLIVCLH